MIDLHPDAVENFNKKTNSFIDYFQSFNPPPQVDRQEAEHYISAKITEDDIIEKIKFQYLTNGIGENIGLIIFQESGNYFIDEFKYEDIRKLIEKISTSKNVKEYVSYKYIENVLAEWLADKFYEEVDITFIDYLKQKLTKDIKQYEVWIPIPYTSSVKNFSLGNIDFKILTEEVIRNWFETLTIKSKKKSDKEDDKTFINQMLKDFQGYIAGIVKIEAEPEKAKENAFNDVSNALSLLRLFSPANFHPLLINGAYEYGWNVYESKKSLLFSSKGDTFRFSTQMSDKGLRWTIDDNVIKFLEAEENKGYNEILKNSNLTKFQDDLLNSIIIYSKNTLKRDISDKIMYILVALESIFLKNDTEPIQQNLSDRIAFFISQNIEERQKVVKLIKDIYGIRSRFIHHGLPSMESIDTIIKFLDLTWHVFNLLLLNFDKFNSKDEFLTQLDTIKYS